MPALNTPQQKLAYAKRFSLRMTAGDGFFLFRLLRGIDKLFTGFAWDSTHIASCNHCLDDGNPEVYRVRGRKLRHADGVIASPRVGIYRHDLAMVRLTKAHNYPTAPHRADPLEPGEPLFYLSRYGKLREGAFIGGTLNKADLVLLYDVFKPHFSASAELMARYHQLLQRGDNTFPAKSRFAMEGKSTPGESGSPIFDAQGRVCGVLSTGFLRRLPDGSMAQTTGFVGAPLLVPLGQNITTAP